MSKILLVEEYSLVRAGIKRLLLDHEIISSVDEAVESSEALSKVRETKPDIVVMNLGSEHLSIFDVTKRMLASNKQTFVLVCEPS